MKIKSILIFLFFFISINNISKADFFKVCGINKTEVNNINYVLKNGNSKFIPREIDDIKNETFKQALYLLSFYKDNSAFPDEMFKLLHVTVPVVTVLYLVSAYAVCKITYDSGLLKRFVIY